LHIVGNTASQSHVKEKTIFIKVDCLLDLVLTLFGFFFVALISFVGLGICAVGITLPGIRQV
jgi:hypothetical protein